MFGKVWPGTCFVVHIGIGPTRREEGRRGAIMSITASAENCQTARRFNYLRRCFTAEGAKITLKTTPMRLVRQSKRYPKRLQLASKWHE
jgi:hypothetical protein